jgi:hypothetical protein
MIPVFTGKTEKGSIGVFIPSLRLDCPERFGLYVESLGDGPVDIIIRKRKSKRSDNQSRYYFGVVCKVLGDYFGYETDEMHEALKIKFLRTGAADLETVRSTTKMNTAEFEEYLERVRRWASAEYGVVVPLPNEVEA